MVKVIDEFYFFADKLEDNQIVLNDTEKHHITKVLRISNNTRITCTDGLGKIAQATISDISKKNITFTDIAIKNYAPPEYHLHLAIAPTKNISRYEWFLEKATEIGISEITPLITENSERKHLRSDRLEKILITATKQSKKAWKPTLNKTIGFNEFIDQNFDALKFMAFIDDKAQHLKHFLENSSKYIVLIGPEGGFSLQEYQQAQKQNYKAVSLGVSRLRAETAGVLATGIINIHYAE